MYLTGIYEFGQVFFTETYKKQTPLKACLLLDERRMKHSRTKEIRNFAEAVFRMDAGQSRDEVFDVVKALAEVSRAPELKALRRAFYVDKGIVETANEGH
uniref:Uncharacterized protein n=1 Tax=uncultured bacterium contig00036 TaxID=1181524 RepID=A0A806KEL2_9BACT|nr:hypothetical protein [uncultured bacterium contig00036]